MSGPGRPQFLPPEEPPPEPAPPEVPAPAPGRQVPVSRTVAVVVGAVAAAAAVVVGLGMLAGGRTSHVPRIEASAPSGPTATPIATLPDPCAAVGDAVPPEMREVEPRRAGDSCRWERLRPERARVLEVSFTLHEPGASGFGIPAATRHFAADYARAANTGPGGNPDDPELLYVGDEAFAARATDLVTAGSSERTAREYEVGGVQVETRLRNAIVVVTWQGADYPKSVRDGRRLTGDGIPYESAKQQAVVIARTALSRLE